MGKGCGSSASSSLPAKHPACLAFAWSTRARGLNRRLGELLFASTFAPSTECNGQVVLFDCGRPVSRSLRAREASLGPRHLQHAAELAYGQRCVLDQPRHRQLPRWNLPQTRARRSQSRRGACRRVAARRGERLPPFFNASPTRISKPCPRARVRQRNTCYFAACRCEADSPELRTSMMHNGDAAGLFRRASAAHAAQPTRWRGGK